MGGDAESLAGESTGAGSTTVVTASPDADGAATATDTFERERPDIVAVEFDETRYAYPTGEGDDGIGALLVESVREGARILREAVAILDR